MADKEVWNLGGPIAAPAATDRVPISTGALAGGYSLRGDFVFLLGGLYRAPGDLQLNSPQYPRYILSRDGIGNWSMGYDGQVGSNNFALRLNGGASFINVGTAGNVGIGLGNVSPSSRLHLLSTGTLVRLESTAARGSGQAHIAFADPTGVKGYLGYANANDGMDIQNVLAANMRLITAGPAIELHTSTTLGAAMTGSDLRPQPDNSKSLGNGAARWTIVYASTGTINTSDEREKKWRGGLSAAEFRAGVRCLEELGFYQWLDAVKAKRGKGQARFHFGARAQRVWGIFADEGLVDPIRAKGPGKTPYAFLCYDKWAAEPAGPKPRKGMPGVQRPAVKAGDRYGLRVDQFALFLVAVLDMRQRQEAARTDALEAALADALSQIADLKKAA